MISRDTPALLCGVQSIFSALKDSRLFTPAANQHNLEIILGFRFNRVMGGIYMSRLLAVSCFLLCCTGIGVAQQSDASQQAPSSVESMDHTPVFHVNVVSRTTKAVNYRHHSGKTTLDLRGTELMPQAKGRVSVESRTGRMEIDADVQNLTPARTFGPEYLTYVLWAITPEGRPSNLGELDPRDGKSSVKVTTDLQAFGLIVTAEPYFAVTQPSNLVVLENVVLPSTKGWEVPIDTKFDLLERGQYTLNMSPAQLPSTTADPKTPTDLLEAQNAIAIARADGADKYAPDVLGKAQDFLNRAEDYVARKQSDKAISTVARGAVQSAEDARVLTIRKRQQEQQEAERRAMEEREAQARAQAEQAQQQEATAKAQAEERARQAEQAQQERAAAEQAKADAERARQDAETAKAAAIQQQQLAQNQAQQAQLTAQQAEQARLQTERDAQQTRERLLQQLNQVLQTKETARGLIVDMPDVLFDTGKYTLKAGARERLAKVAGILLAYPNLHVQVEGHTDNVGGVDFNQQLSQERADSVRSFLTSQGVRPENIDARGFGMTQPVASNTTSAGRQLNRRVDLVVTGEAIGNSTGAANQQVPASGPATSAAPAQAPASGSTPASGNPNLQPVPVQPVPNQTGSPQQPQP
jgi:outer membrane protein OmpA-like peptidoglycan-associated protein